MADRVPAVTVTGAGGSPGTADGDGANGWIRIEWEELVMQGNTVIELSLKQIASRAWRDRTLANVYKTARRLTGKQATVLLKVQAIVDMVRKNARGVDPTVQESFLHVDSILRAGPVDADDAVLAAATLCLSVGIRCRIVGARRGQSWTCWLEYQDGYQWVTVDVLGGVPVGADEQLVVECQGGEMVKEREYAEIEQYDVGRSTFHAFGRHWPVSDFIGTITDVDVGKRVYRVSEHAVGVENAEQFKARRETEVRSHTHDNVAWLANLIYKALNAHRAEFGAPDLVRPPNPK